MAATTRRWARLAHDVGRPEVVASILMTRWRSGSHSGDGLRVACQLTHDRVAVQDLVQDALLQVYRSLRRRGLPPEDWYAYLRRAVINDICAAGGCAAAVRW